MEDRKLKMKIKNQLLVSLILVLTLTSSCERDDICIDEITPHLIVRFYNSQEPNVLKSVNQLSVKILGIDNDSLLFTGLDSIALPLNVMDNNTEFTLTIDSNNGSILNRDILNIFYTVETDFVGRSCGYKANFIDSSYQLNNDGDNWIENIEINSQNIINENTAHVKIFH